MVDFAVKIPSKVARNRAAQTILRFMQVLNPQVRELDDYMHKLYDQLIIMSDFKLDIDNPYPAPERNPAVKAVRPFHYHPTSIRYRYYGKTLEAMIKRATEMPDGKEKDAVLNLITVQMKKSYYLWNDDILSDELVAEHLSEISNGRLTYTDAMRGEVYSNFYNNPSLERKNKYINVSAYENTGRRSYNNNYHGNNYNSGYSGRSHNGNGNAYNNSYDNTDNNGNSNNTGRRYYPSGRDNRGFIPNGSRFKKRRPF